MLTPKVILGHCYYLLIALGSIIVVAGVVSIFLLVSKHYKDIYSAVATKEMLQLPVEMKPDEKKPGEKKPGEKKPGEKKPDLTEMT